MTRSKKSKLERILGKITSVQLSTDRIGKYLSYCSFGYHSGILDREKARDCINKGCWHYRRFYELNLTRKK